MNDDIDLEQFRKIVGNVPLRVVAGTYVLMTQKRLQTKELAAALGKSRRFVCYMKRAGFNMPDGLATVEEAKAWIARNEPASSRKSPARLRGVSTNVADQPRAAEKL